MTEPTVRGSSATPSRGVFIVLSYLWILALVPLLVVKDDREVQWHARNGVLFMVAEVAFWVAFNIVLGATLGIGCAGIVVGPLIEAVFIGIHVWAIVTGLRGQRFAIPFFSGLVERF